MAKEAIIIQTTTNSKDNANKLAESIIKKKFAACIHIYSDVSSIYNWEGKTCTDKEFIVEIKTVKRLKDNIKTEIETIIPYDCPQFIVTEIYEMSDDYERWFKSECSYG